MKRTKSINLDRMRKSAHSMGLKPIAVAITASALIACSSSREAKIYKDVANCVRDNPSLRNQCEAAYQSALAEAAKSGPKYQNEKLCMDEFGGGNCAAYRGSAGQNWFVPALGGYLFARALNGRSGYHSAPLYTSYSRSSPLYGKWSTVDGSLYGTRRYGAVKINDKAFKPKPAVTRTISRGGFGSTVAAKSSWGGSSSRRSWGG